MEKQENSWSE